MKSHLKHLNPTSNSLIFIYYLFIFLKFKGNYQKLMNVTHPIDKYGFLVNASNEFKHHHYEDMERFLMEYNQTYVNITNLKSIGKTVDGREMYVFIISSTPFEHVAGKSNMFNYNMKVI